MTQATDTELTNLITGMREEMRVGFANIDTKFANVTTQITRLDGKIDNLEIKLDSKIDNLDTKINAKIDKLEIKIDGKIDKLDGKFDTINSRLTNIENNTKSMFDLTEKVGELKNWKQIAIVVFTASVSGAIAWYLRGGNQ